MGKNKDVPNVHISPEKQFLFRDSFNRGFVQVPRMIQNCLELSNGAKELYGLISGFIYEQGKSAFPSRGRLALAHGGTEKMVSDYVTELVSKGFIERERGGQGNTNNYSLIDLDKIPHLRVSEMFWKVLVSLFPIGEEKMTYTHVRRATKAIIKELTKNGKPFSAIEVSEPSAKKLKQMYVEYLEKEEEIVFEHLKNRKPNKINTPKAAVGEATGKPLGSPLLEPDSAKENHFTNVHPSDWNQQHFVDYFHAKYRQVMELNHPYGDLKGQRGRMGNNLRRAEGEKELLKQHIDAFFEIGYETPNLSFFSTTTRLAEIEQFLKDGTKPYFVKKNAEERQEQAAIQEVLEMSEQQTSPDDGWLD